MHVEKERARGEYEVSLAVMTNAERTLARSRSKTRTHHSSWPNGTNNPGPQRREVPIANSKQCIS